MRAIKSILTAGAVAAIIGAFSLSAAEPLLTPRATGSPAIVQGGNDADYVQNKTTVGTAAHSKLVGHPVAASTQLDPSLVKCAKIGKLSCPKAGSTAPCCVAADSPCKK